MKQLIASVGAAKSAIDNGFSRVGKQLRASDAVARALMLLASRSVALSNAVVVLASREHSNEALPLLRSLAEFAAAARWIAESDSEARAARFLKEAGAGSWRELFDDARLQARLKAAGAPAHLAERALLSCRDHVLANASGLPWGHLFADGQSSGIPPEELVKAAAAAMRQVVLALDARWPGSFEAPGTPETK